MGLLNGNISFSQLCILAVVNGYAKHFSLYIIAFLFWSLCSSHMWSSRGFHEGALFLIFHGI
ncbi:hypothetical protein BDV29DRAFT_179231 [Aspergillus leporis]|jgi:hypothetical protein|uniref:Uncharacterized protein n=1 Tax=Aspergillus leporis TaxID=41062 RepID=A0A5N5WWF3_9EURO|nr:hypothetical protein BDV29DRAFT_179231 [Aspergillus leporis]